MIFLDLSTKTDIELELLLAKEEKMYAAFSELIAKLESICKKEMDLSLNQVFEFYDYSFDRLNVLKEEIADRKK